MIQSIFSLAGKENKPLIFLGGKRCTRKYSLLEESVRDLIAEKEI